jgi:hypothetical protein
MRFTKDDLGYWWTLYKDFGTPFIVELKFETWDNTRDGDRFVLYDFGEEVPENEWFKYQFISKIEPPTWPYEQTK